MNVISSQENALYKRARRLLRRKYREETGLYLLEGVKPLRDARETGVVPEKVFVCEGTDPAVLSPEDPGTAGGFSGGDLVVLSRELFRNLSDTEHSQGIIAILRRNAPDEAEFARSSEGGHIIVLDRLQDPGNAGTIIRTAEAAGFSGIIALKGTADLYGTKVVRAAAGSLLRMPVLTGLSAGDCVAFAKSTGRRLLVAAGEARVDCFRAEGTGPAALVIGNEGGGACDELKAAADALLRIPMEGKIESLNAAVAAGILMYAIR